MSGIGEVIDLVAGDTREFTQTINDGHGGCVNLRGLDIRMSIAEIVGGEVIHTKSIGSGINLLDDEALDDKELPIQSKFVICFGREDADHLPPRFRPYIADIIFIETDENNEGKEIIRHSEQIRINSIGKITQIQTPEAE